VSEIFAESFLHDRIQGDPVFFGVACGALVQFHGYAHIEASLVRDIGLFATLFAVGNVFIDGRTKVLLKLANACAFIGNEVADAEQAAMEELILGAV
jgi:hypothetical protein